MAGSPKKRARREAAERARQTSSAEPSILAEPAGPSPESRVAPAGINTVPALQGEVLLPVDAEPTRTALKRAMRARAQEHAEKAIAVLVACLESPKEDTRRTAANDLLAWGFGKPVSDVEVGPGDQVIVIRRFGETI